MFHFQSTLAKTHVTLLEQSHRDHVPMPVKGTCSISIWNGINLHWWNTESVCLLKIWNKERPASLCTLQPLQQLVPYNRLNCFEASRDSVTKRCRDWFLCVSIRVKWGLFYLRHCSQHAALLHPSLTEPTSLQFLRLERYLKAGKYHCSCKEFCRMVISTQQLLGKFAEGAASYEKTSPCFLVSKWVQTTFLRTMKWSSEVHALHLTYARKKYKKRSTSFLEIIWHNLYSLSEFVLSESDKQNCTLQQKYTVQLFIKYTVHYRWTSNLGLTIPTILRMYVVNHSKTSDY